MRGCDVWMDCLGEYMKVDEDCGVFGGVFLKYLGFLI